MGEREKFEYLHSKYIDKNVYLYLKNILKNMIIDIHDNIIGNVFDLMPRRYLEGWCWQTTESAIIFFEDNDYIERGYLILDTNKKYYHSWIVFNYNDCDYVFDPCLSIISKKSDYDNIFMVEKVGSVKAVAVKEELFKHISKNNNSKLFKLYDVKEFNVKKTENVNAPIYRNNSKYVLKYKNNKIKKLTVYY